MPNSNYNSFNGPSDSGDLSFLFGAIGIICVIIIVVLLVTNKDKSKSSTSDEDSTEGLSINSVNVIFIFNC